jgi:hypothetical protein
MSLHNTYGFNGSDFGTGNPSIAAYLPGGIVEANVFAGGKASLYPPGNFFPTVTSWQAGFVNYAAGNYALSPTSLFKNAGTDEADLGADMETTTAETSIALAGNLAGGPAPTCAFTVSPSSASMIGAGGSATIAVSTMAGCRWMASSSASWLTIAGGASVTGTGTVKYSAAANAARTSRSATLTVAGKTVTITQTASTAPAPPVPLHVRIVGN